MWEVQWDRPATPEEMKGLIENYIRQEVLYREALRMNLDHNDEVVKRRLSQKMEFMAGDLTKMVTPATESKLEAYFKENQEMYRVATAYSFNHILVSDQNHNNPQAYAENLLSSVNAKEYKSLMDKGDQTMLPIAYKDAGKPVILKDLGTAFYNSLDELALKQWAGPVNSGFGKHLVFITNKTDAHIPDFAEVKNKVKRDYEYQTETTTKEEIYNELKKNYEVIINSKNLNPSQKEKLLANLKMEE